jgi:UDP-N-acetylmuramoyl-tripeptide--D-alanyl-D-alanine ligase
MLKHLAKPLVRWYLWLLVRLATAWHQPYVIAVSGVTNKSTVKRALAARLATRGYTVRATPRNLNTEIGLPLSVLAVEPSGWGARAWLRTLRRATGVAWQPNFPAVLVLEFGISQRGDMRQLLRIIRPQAAVLTNAVPSDYNPRATVDELAAELVDLVRALPPNGFLVYNADDERLVAAAASFGGRTLSYGTAENANVRATNLRQSADELTWETDGVTHHLKQFGRHHADAALAALASERCYDEAHALPRRP